MKRTELRAIREVVSYLADEDIHFWENCECDERIKETEDFYKCKCKANKYHIFREVLILQELLKRVRK